MKRTVGSMDRRQSTLRPTPAQPAVPAGRSRKRAAPKAGRIIEFVTGLHNSRGM